MRRAAAAWLARHPELARARRALRRRSPSGPAGSSTWRTRSRKRPPAAANSASWRALRSRSTQGLDLDLSWSERDLPERVRTKHVHRLHPVPREVHPAARRGALPPSRAGARARARSVRRLGDDARPGARERPRLGRCRHRGVQLPADAREDRRAQPVRARARSARRARAVRARGGRRGRRDRRTCAAGSRRRRATSCCAFARSPTTTSTPTCCASCSRARRGRRGARRTSISTSRRSPQARAVLVLTSTSANAGRSSVPITSCAATRSTR